MAKKVLHSDLSLKGLQALNKHLLEYRQELVHVKLKMLVKRLTEFGVGIVETKSHESPLGKYVTVTTDITEQQAGCKAIIIATGKTKETEGYEPFNTLLAIEFGAGIHHNKTANPKADKLGFGVGSFPNQTHAFDDGWYYWDDEAQEWRYTHGVKATMPMYTASVQLQNLIVSTAREVFK